MKNTLKYYSKIYEPLFHKNYTKSTHRGGVALSCFEKYMAKKNVKVSKVVDIGSAWGKTLRYWKKKGVKAVGVDVSQKAIDFCKKKGFKCYLASATDLSLFSDKKFDLYMASDVYEHLRTEDLQYAIDEAKRITKRYFLIRPHPVLDKRGTLHLTVWSLERWEEFFRNNDLNIIPLGENGETTYKNVFLMVIDK